VLSDDWQRERHGLCASSLRKTKMILFRILTAAVNNGPKEANSWRLLPETRTKIN
jgi:hypothetical protein